jgi:predicted nuclease of predicted toxin-antitoxin system
VKLLFDENLSPRLPEALADIYPGSVHVHGCLLERADDSSIWQFAKDNQFTIVSKDSDFQERGVLHGQPPKFIWLRVPNSSTRDIENLLRAAFPIVKRFIQEDHESCLTLGFRNKPE